jgi:predicted metal-binding membrane protein
MTSTAAGVDTVPHDAGRALWITVGGSWLLLVGTALVDPGLGHHHRILGAPQNGLPPAVALAVVVASWVVMVTSMMLPTTVPMVRMIAVVTARVEHGRWVRSAFLAAYFVVWLAFSGLAQFADAGIHALVERSRWLGAHDGLVLAGTLGLAGVVQLTPLTRRCLRTCRDPRAFLYRHYRRGLAAGWMLGLRHGLSCLGCCWALMLIMFVTGVGNLWWMLALTPVMLVEKIARRGTNLVTPVAVALLLTSAYLTFSTIAASPELPPTPVPTHVH